MTIVTNDQLAETVLQNGGNPFVLEDKIPVYTHRKKRPLEGRHNIVFVCTFEKDEPFEEVIESARLIDQDICIYITGKYQKASSAMIQKAPPNIKFTGFLSEREYVDLLYSSDIVMDLTLMEDCLVCGAYEAVGMEKPMILSDTQALKNYFNGGSVYTKNSAQAIAITINTAVKDLKGLEANVKKLKLRLVKEWGRKLNQLETIMRVDNP